MSERILVPLDGSGLGEVALEYLSTLLSRLAPEKKTIIHLMHVITNLTHEVNLPGDGAGSIRVSNSPEEMKAIETESRRYLEQAASRLKSASVEAELVIRSGTNPAEEIIRVEEERECDLVVMSTHGRSGISRWAFGSVTDKVLRAGKVPVLLVRADKAA